MAQLHFPPDRPPRPPVRPPDDPNQSDLETEVEIEGIVARIVYENPENGYVVARMSVKGRPDLVTFVGSLLAVSPGETVRVTGRWVDDKKFGRQIRVTLCETILPSTVETIESYLGSGLITGIGPEYAKRLVQAFGEDTLRVIDRQPERLRAVPGIGPKRARQIRDAWNERRAVHSVMLFLQGCGVTPGQAVKIFKEYGGRAATVIRDNPYRLAGDITGIGFQSEIGRAHV